MKSKIARYILSFALLLIIGGELAIDIVEKCSGHQTIELDSKSEKESDQPSEEKEEKEKRLQEDLTFYFSTYGNIFEIKNTSIFEVSNLCSSDHDHVPTPPPRS